MYAAYHRGSGLLRDWFGQVVADENAKVMKRTVDHLKSIQPGWYLVCLIPSKTETRLVSEECSDARDAIESGELNP